ncbi:MAG: hypothetical protein HOP10_09925 [Chitinophagaceae bacterium]|nr:hypothetical protein [Chitinophagaceae bacterium]
MKNKIILVGFFALSLLSCSKSDDDASSSGNITVIPASAVPATIMTTFNNNFPGASQVEWQRNGSNNSVGSDFNQNSQRHHAGFDDSGHQSSHSIICLEAPVPQVVLDAFRSNFPTDSVYEWKLRNDGTWRAHIMRGSIKYEATFSASGSLIKFERSK